MKGKNSIRRVRNLIRSIEVRKFVLDLDTGHPVANAYCYPLFYALRGPRRDLRVNWQGRRRLDLELRAVPAKMLFAYFK
jgi:hypothetical protein